MSGEQALDREAAAQSLTAAAARVRSVEEVPGSRASQARPLANAAMRRRHGGAGAGEVGRLPRDASSARVSSRIPSPNLLSIDGRSEATSS